MSISNLSRPPSPASLQTRDGALQQSPGGEQFLGKRSSSLDPSPRSRLRDFLRSGLRAKLSLPRSLKAFFGRFKIRTQTATPRRTKAEKSAEKDLEKLRRHAESFPIGHRLKMKWGKREHTYSSRIFSLPEKQMTAYFAHADAITSLVHQHRDGQDMSKSDQNAALAHLRDIDALFGLHDALDLNEI